MLFRSIVVLVDGAVEAVGSHAELYAAGGTYRRFWDDQEAVDRWRLVGPAKDEEAPEADGQA